MVKSTEIITDDYGNLVPQQYESILNDDDDYGFFSVEEFLKEYNDSPEIYGDINSAYCIAYDVPENAETLTFPSAIIVKAENFDADEIEAQNKSPQSDLDCKILSDGYIIFFNCDSPDKEKFMRYTESAKTRKANLKEHVFTDRDFDRTQKTHAKPGEIWSAVQNLQDMFENAKKDGNRRMKENLTSFNGRRVDSFKETGLKNISDAELKAEYRRRFGESTKKNEKKTTLRESMNDYDLEEVNEYLDDGKNFYLRSMPDGIVAVAFKSGYDSEDIAKDDIEEFLDLHGDEFDLDFYNAELVNDNDDEWVFALS